MRTTATPGEADLPGILAGIQIHDGPPMTGQTARPAIIQNHATRTWAATARIVHPGIGMSDEADRFRMGAGLTEMMEAATAGNQIDLVVVQVRTIPDDGTERDEWVRRNARPDEPEVSARVNAQLEADDRRRGGAPRGVRDRGGPRGRHQQGRQARRTRRDRAGRGSCTRCWPRSRPG